MLKIIISHRHEIADRPKSIIEVMQNQLLLDYEQTDENYIDHIQKVTKDDVISMANKAELDTIYVLTKGIILNEETYYELIDERVLNMN